MINYGNKNDFTPAQAVSVDLLPAGSYIGKIYGAKVEPVANPNGSYDRLVLQLDVTEGEYKDHFHKQFEAQKGGQYEAKYKGVVRYRIPVAGDQYEKQNKRILENVAWALEDSNKGYKWDWDESKLKGLSIGFTVRERDWLMEDAQGLRTGTTTEIGRLDSVNKVRSGDVKPMKKRELRDAEKQRLQEYNAGVSTSAQPTMVVDDDLPF